MAARPEIEARRLIPAGSGSLGPIQALLDEGTGKGILDRLRVGLSELDQSFQRAEHVAARILVVSLAKDVVDQETGQRGFLLTGSVDYLSPFQAGRSAFDRHLNELRGVVRSSLDKEATLAALDRLEETARRWLTEAGEPEIAGRREITSSGSSTLEFTQATLRRGTGKAVLDEMRAVFATLENELRRNGAMESAFLAMALHKAMVDQETGERGFLITGEDSFLEPYTTGRVQFEALSRELRPRLQGSRLTGMLDELVTLADEWHRVAADPEIAARRDINRSQTTPLEFAQAALARGEGKAILDEIRVVLARIEAAFDKIDDERGRTAVLAAAKAIVDQETGERGYLITGEDTFLEPFERGQAALSGHLEIIRVLTSNAYDRAQVGTLVAGLSTLSDRWESVAGSPEIELRRDISRGARSHSDLEDAIRGGLGKSILDELRDEISRLHLIFSRAGASTTLLSLLDFSKAIVDRETGQRGFLITGNEEFLQPYVTGRTDVARHLMTLAALSARPFDREGMLEDIALLEIKAAQWLATAARPEIRDRRELSRTTASMADITALIDTSIGKDLMDEIRGTIEAFLTVEADRLDSRVGDARDAARNMAVNSILGGVIGILMASFAGWLVSKELIGGISALLSGTNSLAGGRLATRVPVHHDNEIGRLSRAFNIMAARLEDSQDRLMGAAESQTLSAMESHEQQLLLAESNRNLSEFAHGVSHDLKAPLRQISTFATLELERGSELELETRTTLEQVITLSGQMKELVDGVMSFADTDPSLQVAEESVELSQVVDDVRNTLTIRIEETGASFEVGPLLTVTAHKALMRQLFQNLIDNALKYRRPGDSPHIRIYSRESSGGVEVCVADNGIGFSEKAAERLFEPFTRLVGAEVASGAGIGMATARRIMDRFGGRISAQGLPGQGAIFTTWFPATEAPQQAEPRASIPVPCQLLLVDDSVEDRLIARRFIDKDLFTIIEADSAETAMKILRRETVHAVLSDFRMPGTDGLELLQRIRKHYPHIMTMLCSGGRLPEGVAGDPAIQAHFEKPPDAEGLSEAVFGDGDVPEAA